MIPSDQHPGNVVAVRNNPLQGFAIAAATMDEAMRICEYISKSGMVPKSYIGNPAAVWVAGAMGARLGLDLFQSLNGIASINGRPSVWGDLARALILRHPELEALQEGFSGEGDELTAHCKILRKGLDVHEESFSLADAKKARLTEKDIWRLYPKDMLASKAFARAARRRFADALQGLDIHGADDIQTVDHEVVGSSPLPETRPARQREIPGAPAVTKPSDPPAKTTANVVSDQAPAQTATKASDPAPANKSADPAPAATKPATDPAPAADKPPAPVQTSLIDAAPTTGQPTVAGVIAKARAWHATVDKAEGLAALNRICHALGVAKLAQAEEDQAVPMLRLLNEEIAGFENAKKEPVKQEPVQQ
jgi:hypothetical protein